MADSKDNDVTYWRAKAEELERELEEFRESSQMLEKELENSLEQADKTVKELRFSNNALVIENDTLKIKFEEYKTATEAHISQLEDETAHWHRREEEYVKCIRELEQKNDDLERSQRALFTTASEFETKSNSALERNAFLESELEEKEILKAMLQRLKDEARDLKQENLVKNKHPETEKGIDSNKIGTDPPNTSPGHAPPFKSIVKGMTPASRITAMNIVNDLLRRVGVLESKFAAAASLSRAVCDSPGDGTDREQYRGGRLPRGTSSPSIHNLLRS